MIGSREAVKEATQLLDACADLLGVGTTRDEAEVHNLRNASRRVIYTRETFIHVVRTELGKEVVEALAEHSQQQDNSTEPNRTLAQAIE